MSCVSSLVFRREPLWQPMLNVRLTPALRCAYDAEELVLRVLHLECAEGGAAHEPVLYALKVRSCFKHVMQGSKAN
jgi:hypothetical protein